MCKQFFKIEFLCFAFQMFLDSLIRKVVLSYEWAYDCLMNVNRFRNTPSTGGMYRPGSYSDKYEDDRYGGRDEDRNGYGYGKDREWGSRDDDRYGRSGDSYSRDGDRYGREYDERNGREGYRDDDYHGRSRSVDEYQYGSRSRSSDRERERAYDDDGQYSSR